MEEIEWESRFAARTKRMQSSVIRELLKLTVQPEIISFAGGLPAPEFFPVREFQEACRYVLDVSGPAALQYSPSEGYVPLKEFLGEAMSKYGIQVEIENILLVHGSQQGLDLIGKLFVDTDACILTSRPTYLGGLQAWNAYEAQYCTVPMDEDGMIVEEIPGVLRSGTKPRFVYVLPNFHNPAGTTLSLERRQRWPRSRAARPDHCRDARTAKLRFEENILRLAHGASDRSEHLFRPAPGIHWPGSSRQRS
jgi:2-aminoadipate transaminase